ncbi:MAG: hypothetical protein HYU28_12610 [Actinobacteria bacterium]|nr:hypothetical protein [Actinomycetota bacterium]
MASTFEALAIVLVFVVPGAAYMWSFERHVGAFGIGAVDRALRFIAASLIVHLILGWPEYLAWSTLGSTEGGLEPMQFAVFWGLLLLLTAAPAAAGWVIGSLWTSRNQRQRHRRLRRLLHLSGTNGARREARLLRFALGRAPAPRAWDHLFASNPSGLVRAQLKDDGAWIGGLFRSESYAAGYPEEPQDLFLERAYEMDSTGGFVSRAGHPVQLGSGILVRWEEIRYLEFFPD